MPMRTRSTKRARRVNPNVDVSVPNEARKHPSTPTPASRHRPRSTTPEAKKNAMAGLAADQLAELRLHFQNAVVGCADRGLYHSSKWAAEMLNSLPGSSEHDNPSNDGDNDSDWDEPVADTTPAAHRPSQDPQDARLEAAQLHKFLLAKSFFDCREYDRCAAVFLPSTRPRVPKAPDNPSPTSAIKKHAKGKERASQASQGAHQSSGGNGEVKQPSTMSLRRLSQRALFLAIYSKYMAGEKRKDEDSEMVLGPADGGVTLNKELPGLIEILGNWLTEAEENGRNGAGWLEYLYGILLAKNKSEDQAKLWYLKSVHLYPFNWGAWQELSNLLNTVEELDAMIPSLPQNIMSFIFRIYTMQELGQATEKVFVALDQVSNVFPNSAFLKTQRAQLYYHAKDLDESAAIFTSILVSEPYRLDAMDNYSNVLYVLDNRPKLAFLAHLATSTDKFRPETCCIVGNYYSRNSEHEKAVVYFRRALTLDRNFLSAWTLMGYEYVEMKNSHAALESYRRAVDVNRKDYRAWHGLGLTYEMLEMHSYALYYHQRAAALRPFDAKTWQAVGACFARVGKIGNAIRAYKRALVAGSYNEVEESQSAGAGSSFGSGDGLGSVHPGTVLDPESLYQIALLHERMDEPKECAAYMELVLAQEEGSGPELEDALGGLVVSNSQDSASVGGANAASGLPGVPQRSGSGVGVTATTSKARMWLAKYAYESGEYQRANELANEMCQDGVEVEEAKALMRDIRSRVESERVARLREG